MLKKLFDHETGLKIDQLESSLQLYKIIMDSITDFGVFLTEPAGKILYYNKAASLYDNVSQDEAIGENYRKIYYDDDGGVIAMVVKTKQPVRNKITKFWNKKNELKVCIDSGYPVWINDKMVAILVLTRYEENLAKNVSDSLAIAHMQEFAQLQQQYPQLSTILQYGTYGARYDFSDLVGENEEFLAAVKNSKEAAFRSVPVMLVAERGCETNIFAQSIHSASLAEKEHFVQLNCAVLSEEQLEIILWGDCAESIGFFNSNFPILNGTLFLEEIQCMPLRLQAKLFLEMSKIFGDFRTRRTPSVVPYKWRIIASCSWPLLECVKNNILSRDLAHMLSEVCIEIPPLRRRLDDIPLLTSQFIWQQIEYNFDILPDFEEALQLYSWPGNLDELHKVLGEALLRKNPSESLSLQHLNVHLRTQFSRRKAPQYSTSDGGDEYGKQKDMLKEVQDNAARNTIEGMLMRNDYNITKTAAEIGISRSNLQHYIRKLNIKIENKKD